MVLLWGYGNATRRHRACEPTSSLSTKATITVKPAQAGPGRGLQAVVIGGGIAGLLTAHSLARHIDRVVLLEKDAVSSARVENETFKQTARRRTGVPQIIQPHQLINGAVVALETLLPGFRDEVIAKGGLPLDLGLDVHYYDYGALYPKAPSNLQGLGVTRRFLEQCIRDRVCQEGFQSGVLIIHENKRVAELVWESDSVRGVVLDDGETIHGDLVVDASGRRSQAVSWLEQKGFSPPRTISVDPHVSSASRIVAMPENWEQDWKLLVCKTQPDGRRGGTLLPTEGNMWQVTLAEINGAVAPKNDAEFLEFAKSLPDKTMYEALLRSRPITDVINYNAMKSELVCYHEIKMPRGLVVVGDAVQRHNAIYGQGIAATARGIVLLDQHLDRLQLRDPLRNGDEALAELGSTFQPALTQHLRSVWDLAVKSDLRYNGTTVQGDTKRAPTGFDRFLTDIFLTAAQTDSYVYHELLSVAHLAKPADTLLTNTRVLMALLGAAFIRAFQRAT